MNADKRRWLNGIVSLTLLFVAFSSTTNAEDESYQINYYELFSASKKLSLFHTEQVFPWTFALSREWELEQRMKLRGFDGFIIAGPPKPDETYLLANTPN